MHLEETTGLFSKIGAATERRASLTTFLAAVLMVLCVLVCAGNALGAEVKYEPVEKVIDGDTVILASGEHVRLIGVQAPEIGQCYSDNARLQLQGVLSHGAHVIRHGKDKYGRTLAYLYVPWSDPAMSGYGARLYRNSVNLYLIINGYAKSYRRFPHNYSGSYNKAEAWAKKNKQGIWQTCQPHVP